MRKLTAVFGIGVVALAACGDPGPTAFTPEGGALAALFDPGTSGVVTWKGNGTDAFGACSKVTVDPTVTGQNWLFVLTQAQTNKPLWLKALFNAPTGSRETGPSKVNNNLAQFSVNTAAHALLLEAEAITGRSNSILTVSHCEVGVVSQWCSPGYWRNAQDAAWEPTGAVRWGENATRYNDVIGPGKFGSDYCPVVAGDPSLQDVLNAPQTYGGTAFNCVGDYLSYHHPDVPFVDGIRTPDSCPLNNAGELE